MTWAERLEESLSTDEGKRLFVRQFPAFLLVEFIVTRAFKDFLRWKLNAR